MACGGGSDKPSGDTDITKVADNFARVNSFKVTIVGGPNDPRATVEYQQPGTVRATAGSGAQEQQIICLDSDFYARRDGQWQKVPQGGGSNPSCRANLGASDPKVIGDGIKMATSDPAIVKGGTAEVGGKACQLYTHNVPGGAGTFELCIADGLPQRIVSKSTSGQSVTLTFSDYGKEMGIKAPI
jgi:hypothetical protein